jgi:hypothetical protein
MDKIVQKPVFTVQITTPRPQPLYVHVSTKKTIKVRMEPIRYCADAGDVV